MAETIYAAFNRQESIRRGIDPKVTEAAWNTEGGLIVPARRGQFETGWSWWAPQLHYGGAEYSHYGTTAGMGNGFTRFTGWQPGDPRAWQDALRYALDEVKRDGWGKWYGPATVGITGMRGVDMNFHWPGTPDNEWDFRQGIKAPIEILYDHDARVDQQPDDWSCSIQSAEFFLRSMGRAPADQWIQDQLLGRKIVTRESGLMDASGQQLANWLTVEYGTEGGWIAQSADVTFDDVWAGAGVNPTMVGGRRWGASGHWAGVRRQDGSDALLLANPANGYNGIGQRITRTEWGNRGPWSAIWVDRLSTLAPAPEPPAPPAITKAQVIERLRALQAMLDAHAAAEQAEMAALLEMAERLEAK